MEELVTLASIIEKETADPAERHLVSAVLHNRLQGGMMLQSDPTVIYGIRDFQGNLTSEDLQKDHPDNTYLVFYRQSFDASSMASGVFSCTLETGSFGGCCC